jgi:hypothetical protein
MNSSTRLQLVGAAVRSGFSVFEKSASAAPAQLEVLQAGWPQPDEPITKLASLSRVLATGLMVEEAEASLGA